MWDFQGRAGDRGLEARRPRRSQRARRRRHDGDHRVRAGRARRSRRLRPVAAWQRRAGTAGPRRRCRRDARRSSGVGEVRVDRVARRRVLLHALSEPGSVRARTISTSVRSGFIASASAGRRSAGLSPARCSGGRVRRQGDVGRPVTSSSRAIRARAITPRCTSSPLGAGCGRDRPVALVTGFSAGWHFIDGRDGQLYFRTDAGAPFGRIVRFDLNARAEAPNRAARRRRRMPRHDRRRCRCERPTARQLAAQREQPPGHLVARRRRRTSDRTAGDRHDQRPRRAVDGRARVSRRSHRSRRRRRSWRAATTALDPDPRERAAVRSVATTSPSRCGIRRRTARRSRCSWSANGSAAIAQACRPPVRSC